MTSLPIDNVWGMLTAIGVALISGWWGYLTLKTKGGSDKKDEAVQPVLEKVEQTVNLQPAVNALSARVAACEEELAQYRPIAKVKYPLALNTIANFRQMHPTSTVYIPHQIQEDL